MEKSSERTLSSTPRVPSESLRQIELGFMFDHSVMAETSRQVLSTATASFAVAEMLIEKGILDRTAYENRRREIEASLLAEIDGSGLGILLNADSADKYQVQSPPINCAERLPICKAACCTLRFPLSRQDVEEAVVRWDLGRPYVNLRDESGYCVHCQNGRCSVYEQRPTICRSYDCRNDARIWSDFERMVLNPECEKALSGSLPIGDEAPAPKRS